MWISYTTIILVSRRLTSEGVVAQIEGMGEMSFDISLSFQTKLSFITLASHNSFHI